MGSRIFKSVLYYFALLEPFSNSKRTNRAPRPLPLIAGAKTKNFPSFLLFLGGGYGGSRQKMERKFLVFASPFQTTKRAILF